MKKEASKKNTKPKKEEKYKIFDSVKLKRTEFIITLVVGVIFLVLLLLWHIISSWFKFPC